MAYIGRGTDTISNVEVLDNLTFNGSASYTLQKSSVNFVPSSANNLLISISGVVQQGNFSVSGSTITFDTVVAGTDTCDWILHYGIGLITTVADGTITEAKLGSNAVTTAKINNGAVTNAKLQNSSITLNGSAVSLGGSATIGGGKIGQVISTTKTDTFSTSSTSYVDVTGLSLSITPSATSSKVFVLVNLSLSPSAQAFYNIVRNSTNIAQPTSAGSFQATGGVFFNTGDGFAYINSSVLDSPNTTSATTYKIQMKSTGGNADINKRYSDTFIACVSTMTLMEVLA